MKKTMWIAVLLLSLYSCQDDESALLYMVYGETGCANPWDMSRDENRYIDNIRAYLYAQKVWAFSINIRNELPEGMELCDACHCWSGRNIYIRIPPDQRGEAEEIGFIEVEE